MCLVVFQRPLEKTLASKAIGCTASLLPLVWVSVYSVVELERSELKYCTSAIVTQGLCFFNPLFDAKINGSINLANPFLVQVLNRLGLYQNGTKFISVNQGQHIRACVRNLDLQVQSVP